MRLLLPLLLLLAACSTPSQPVNPPQQANRLNFTSESFKPLTDTYKEYVAALIKLKSPNPQDNVEGLQRVQRLNYHFFADDRALIAKAVNGDEAARKELGRRGDLLDAMLAFWGKINQAKWTEARQRICLLGEDARVVLVTMLLRMLINGQFRETWPAIRYQLVEVGDEARTTTQALLEAKEAETPDTVIHKGDDLVQLGDVLLGFGDKTKVTFRKFLTSPKPNVRKSMAQSIAECRASEYVGDLIGMMELDTAWVVRSAAAEALGKVNSQRPKTGAALMDRLGKERDAVVRQYIVRALGEIGFEDAVPILIQTLDTPNGDVVEEAMRSLNRITLNRTWSTDAWRRWYQTDYASWKANLKK